MLLVLLPENSLVCVKSHIKLALLRGRTVLELIGKVDSFGRLDHRYHRFVILGMTYLLAHVPMLMSILMDGNRGPHALADARSTSVAHLVQRIVV